MSSDKPSYFNTFERQIRVAETAIEEDKSDDMKLNKLVEANLNTGIGSVEKIRDILFGNQIRDYDKRFKRLEERLIQESQQMRDDMSNRMHALEELLNSEVDALSEKNKAERQERILNVQDLQHELNALKNEVNNRSAQLEEQFSKELKLLRQQLHSKTQEIVAQLRLQNDNLTGLVSQEISQLQEEKVSRSDLAAFFSEFALRLEQNSVSRIIEEK
ncbi:hypothetical protein [Beggiatoa leptomitoformis]|uniref:Uncharacterized protein n=1 Tax=Beggiatoa leptomitoformis TaxID=288004 RepID=A0A2N9YDD3_9GAMM|nr:hypothetical protein [Beggiatoa leptomitoformis]ALG69120.1 hypothetical protein AL038_17295 [Beggiatoa leptomitoformis]AUI68466.1 hypothetical protein BLE401_06930 [Beggiatoa leptomitoformis]